MEGYYCYLPATFIYGEFSKESVIDTSYLKTWPGTEKIHTKYTCGVALMEAPFFLVTHFLSKPLGFKSNGHSNVYSYGIMIASIFYMLFGMYLLYLKLSLAFTKKVTWFVLCSTFLGTNLYYYTLFQPGMSHVYSFSLYALMVLLTDTIINNEKWSTRNFILLGIISSLIVLVRPTGIVFLLYPLYHWSKVTKNKLAFFRNHAWQLGWMALVALLIWAPQFIYWKSITGHWIMWSYGDESFKYWREPKLIRVLIDPWNGWLLYTPLAIIPLLSLALGRKANKHSEQTIINILLLATYLFASWWAWWFGGAFGHRSFVEFYALLAIPFAVIVDQSFSKRWKTILIIALVSVFIYYNLALTYQYHPPWDGPNWTYESWWYEVKKAFGLL